MPRETVTTLKDCPFCGGKPYLFNGRLSQESPVIACTACGAEIQGNYEADVIEKWEQRHAG